MQLELLEKPDLSRAAARRRAMDDARERGEHGMERAARRQARLHADWCDEALEALRRFARGQVGMWTIETARSVIELDLPKPAESRAWGQVVQTAARLGYIEKTALSAPTVSSNASNKPLWRRGKKA